MADINIGPTKAEDSPHFSGDQGVMALGVRNDAGAALAADGDYIPLSTDSTGALRTTSTGGSSGTEYDEGTQHVNGDKVTMAGVVQQAADAALSSDGDRSVLQVDGTGFAKVNVKTSALPTGAATLAEQQTQTASLSVLDDWDETDRAKVNPIVGQAGVQGGSGAVSANTQRVVLATDVTPPLPTGAATAANQTTEIASLQEIDNIVHSNGEALNEFAVIGGHLDDVATVTPAEGQVAAIRITAARGEHVNLRTVAGVEAGTSGSPLRVDPTGSTTQPISAAALPLPAGASTLAEQQTQTASLSILDDWDESDRAKVNPIAGQAGVQGGSGTVTALTQRVVLATDVGLPAGTNLIGDVDVAPRTTGGWLVGNFTSGDTYTALTNSAQVIKGSAGKFGGYYIYNPNNTAIYVLVYDIAAASVTVGTSTAKLVFCIPAASAANLELLAGIPFATAMSIAATTTGDGNTAPTVALEAMVFYK